MTSAVVYGVSLVALFAASALHHAVHPASEAGRRALRRLDHFSIFILIAGTYTPLCLVGLGGGWGWSIFGVIWGLAVGGILLKIFWLHAPRWLSTVIYIAMGWTVAVAFPVILDRFPLAAFSLVLGGGVIYTVGAVVYARKRPDPWPSWLGFHGVWHVFVVGGAALHYWFVVRYVL